MCLLERKASKNILRKLQWWFLTNKIFWSIVKPFLTNKGHIEGEEKDLKICEFNNHR